MNHSTKSSKRWCLHNRLCLPSSCSLLECPTKSTTIQMAQTVHSHQNSLKQSLAFVFVNHQLPNCLLRAYQELQRWRSKKDVQGNDQRTAYTSYRPSPSLLLILCSRSVSLSFKLTPLRSTLLLIAHHVVLLEIPPQSCAMKETIKMWWVLFSYHYTCFSFLPRQS